MVDAGRQVGGEDRGRAQELHRRSNKSADRACQDCRGARHFALEVLGDPMDPVRIAIVGAGLMASEHARAFSTVAGTELVAIHSRTRQKAEQLAAEHRIPLVADSIAGMAASGANLVVVAVPELSAREVILACLEHKWTMLLEKPAGYNLAEAELVERAARRSANQIFVALNRRFYSSFLRVRDALGSVEGERRFIHVQDQQSYAEARAHNHPEEVVHHFMYANSIHNIDLIRA